MRARDIMTTKVVTVHPATSVEDIARRLLEHGISAAPVMETDGRIVGIVSEGDLMRRTELKTAPHESWWLSLLLAPEEKAARYVKTHGRVAEDIMTRPAISVGENATLAEIAELLEKRRIKRVPVLRDGQLVGIVSRANLLHGLAAGRVATESGDQTIRKTILDTMKETTGVRDAFVNVTVLDGIVQLWGSVLSEEERKAVRVLAENTPGVKRVENHLAVLKSQPTGI